jgi:DNA processing protein
VLFTRGKLEPGDKPGVAVVGTRRPSHYGQQVAERLARELAENGVTVVSGLARGIDTCAHKAALAAGGRTIAVLGCGIDVYYPPENRKLCDAIAERGAVLSEFNLGTEPLAMNFPKRNRVVSGLSSAVVAVEAGEKSGVLNTCAWALDQGRPVYAVPGRISDQTSIGTNRLLREGAKPLTSAADLLRDLGLIFSTAPAPAIPVSDSEQPVLDFLSSEPQHADEICQGLGLPMSKLLGVLAQMELKGLIRQLPGKYFVRAG